MLGINTNVMSLNAQRNLSGTGGALATSLERLSSGMRINSAKDDAAGLAISERFSTQIRGIDQAARNANDGISMVQTAEGSMVEISNNMQRIRELAVQSRNATNSSSDRAALNAEAQQLKSEIDRVAGQAAFNGVKLLDGSFTNQAFQVGANQGETISIASIANASSAALGTWTSVTTSSATATVAAADLAAPTAVVGPPASEDYAALTFTINGEDVVVGTISEDTVAEARDARLAQVATAINDANIAGVSASINDDGELVITSAEAFEVAGANGTVGLSDGTVAVSTVAGTAQTGFASLDISTIEGADNAILAMDGALAAINTARADLGAIQNRFESVVNSLQTMSENLSASRSRIMDADFAKETASLSRAQILQQAGVAMLAQANAAPQQVLSLLR
jgi:flagellin